jgi:hypothetical protein
MPYIRSHKTQPVQVHGKFTRVSHPKLSNFPHHGVQPGEVIFHEKWVPDGRWFTEVPEGEAAAILKKAMQKESADSGLELTGDAADNPDLIEDLDPSAEGVVVSPTQMAAMRKGGLSFSDARDAIKEYTNGAVTASSYDVLLENYAAWSLAVG